MTCYDPCLKGAQYLIIPLTIADRHHQLTLLDPVRRINTTQFIRHHLQQAIIHCGGQEAFQRDWLANVDSDVITSFGKLGVL